VASSFNFSGSFRDSDTAISSTPKIDVRMKGTASDVQISNRGPRAVVVAITTSAPAFSQPSYCAYRCSSPLFFSFSNKNAESVPDMKVSPKPQIRYANKRRNGLAEKPKTRKPNVPRIDPVTNDFFRPQRSVINPVGTSSEITNIHQAASNASTVPKLNPRCSIR